MPAPVTHVVVHPHVRHGQERPFPARRDIGAHSLSWRERAGRKTAAVHRLGEERVSPVLAGLDDDVVRLRDRDTELVGLDRLHVKPVLLDDGHRQPGDPEVEERRGRSVDDAEPHPLARLEQPRPVLAGRHPVHEIRIRGTIHVGEVGRVHAHFAPHQSITDGRSEPPLPGVTDEVEDRALLPVVVVRLLLQARHDAVRVFEGPIAEEDDVLAVVLVPLRPGRIDDERPVVAELLLHPGVTVVPVRPVLHDGIPVFERLARPNAGEVHPGHTIHRAGQQDAVPVDRGVFVERIRHADDRLVPFAKAKDRARKRTIDGRRPSHTVPDLDGDLTDGQVDRSDAAVDDLGATGQRAVPGSRISGRERIEAGKRTDGGAYPQEAPPGEGVV